MRLNYDQWGKLIQSTLRTTLVKELAGNLPGCPGRWCTVLMPGELQVKITGLLVG